MTGLLVDSVCCVCVCVCVLPVEHLATTASASGGLSARMLRALAMAQGRQPLEAGGPSAGAWKHVCVCGWVDCGKDSVKQKQTSNCVTNLRLDYAHLRLDCARLRLDGTGLGGMLSGLHVLRMVVNQCLQKKPNIWYIATQSKQSSMTSSKVVLGSAACSAACSAAGGSAGSAGSAGTPPADSTAGVSWHS
jgi:hypothetical protein